MDPYEAVLRQCGGKPEESEERGMRGNSPPPNHKPPSGEENSSPPENVLAIAQKKRLRKAKKGNLEKGPREYVDVKRRRP